MEEQSGEACTRPLKKMTASDKLRQTDPKLFNNIVRGITGEDWSKWEDIEERDREKIEKFIEAHTNCKGD